ncbi:MAG TPA: hypothetical protein VJN70_01630 [Gemmatimonadaceae bacterium]|nr:hypothetical protein [Gemmatimonadaceae bacterium]
MSMSFAALGRLSAVLLALACSRITLPPPSDSQRTLVGDWTVEFRLDSLRTTGTWSPASRQSAQGTLHLADSDGQVRSSIQMDFRPLLGREMSCFVPRPTSTFISRAGENTSLVFTPGAADCGFSASGKFYGDSLIGTWGETSFIGPVAAGQFRMVRR